MSKIHKLFFVEGLKTPFNFYIPVTKRAFADLEPQTKFQAPTDT